MRTYIKIVQFLTITLSVAMLTIFAKSGNIFGVMLNSFTLGISVCMLIMDIFFQEQNKIIEELFCICKSSVVELKKLSEEKK